MTDGALILLVEDDKSTATLIAHLLGKARYEVITAEHGEDALKMLEAIKPDMIISDVTMPVMGGFEFRDRLLEDARFAQLPFLFLTARAQEAEFIEALEHEPTTFMQKPFEIEDLLQKIEQSIAQAKSYHTTTK